MLSTCVTPPSNAIWSREQELADILGGAKATAIEKFFLKLYGPFIGNSIARVYGGIVLFSAMGALGIDRVVGRRVCSQPERLPKPFHAIAI